MMMHITQFSIYAKHKSKLHCCVAINRTSNFLSLHKFPAKQISDRPLHYDYLRGLSGEGAWAERGRNGDGTGMERGWIGKGAGRMREGAGKERGRSGDGAGMERERSKDVTGMDYVS